MREPLLTFPEVAERLGVPLNSLYRNHRVLREEHGFPAPVPGLGRRWDPQAIENWLATQRGEPVPIGQLLPPDTTTAEVFDWQQELDRRALEMGRAG